MSRRKSLIWNHFIETKPNITRCVHCNRKLRIRNMSTTNLIRHMKNKHPNISYKEPATKATPILTIINEIKAESSSDDEEGFQDVDLSMIPIQSSQNQDVRVDVMQRTHRPKCNSTESPRAKEINVQLIKMITKHYYPYKIVEDEEFKKFVHLMCPEYTLPDAKAISQIFIPQMHHSAEVDLEKSMSKVTAVCLAMDEWTSINKDSFILISVGYISELSEYQFKALRCETLSMGYDNAQGLASMLHETAVSWGIEDKIVAVVSDESSSIIKEAVRIRRWHHISCFAHAINKIVHTSFNENMDIINLIMKIKAIVEYFNRNPSAQAKLSSAQEEMNLPNLKLKQDSPSRWNSTYDMLSRINQCKEAVIKALSTMNSKLYYVSSDEWTLVSKLCDILDIFNAVTTELMAEKVTTLSKLTIMANVLRKNIDNHLRMIYHPILRDLLTTLKKETAARLTFHEQDELCLQTTILDPRFKKFGFPNSDLYEQAYQSVGREMQRVLSAIKESTIESVNIKKTNSTTSSLLWQDFDEEVGKTKVSLTPGEPSIEELDNYLKEPVIDRNANPLRWWATNKAVYPMLYDLALDRLCISATSVPSERLFSKSGDVLALNRSRLTSSQTTQIVVLGQNLV